jgi:hypothetical protein
MSIPSLTVGYFRDQWADRFVDSCVVTRVTGSTFNDTTGETEETTAQVYSGECLVRPAQAGHGEVDFGEDRRQEVDYDIYLPFDAATLENGDEVSVTADLDPNIPTLTVLKGFTDSYLTRRHYETKVISDD